MPIDPDRLVPGGALLGPVFARLASSTPDVDREVPADAFGPFRAVREIGRGGMAVVWLGERVDGEFEQQVALKVVSVSGNTESLHELFRQERQLLARLVHPNIARLLDGGRLDDGRLWFALDLVEGQRIDHWCRDHRLPIDARVALFRQVCDALAFAHARLAIHRDIKPSNILVSNEGQVKLLDFGIAALLDDAGVAIAPTHALTPGFASPEHVRGDAATTASDIWQLGTLLKCLLDDGTRDDRARERRALPADRDLVAIIARATAADPADRYRTVAELLDDLDRRRERRPVRARRAGAAYRLRRFFARHRWSVTGIGLGVLILAATAIVFTLSLARERDAANLEAERATAALGFLTDMFRVANPAVNRGDALSANEILERGTMQLQTDLVDQPDVRASLLDTIGRVHMGLGQSARAEPLLQQSVVLTRSLPARDPLLLAARLRALAQTQWRLGELGAARASCDEALALMSDPEADPELRARLLNTRAIVTLLLGDAGEAERLQRAALVFIDATVGADSALAGYAWNNLGRALVDQRRIGEAAEAFAHAVVILQSTLGADHPDTLDIATSHARQIAFSGRVEEGLAALAETQREVARVLGEQDSRFGFTVLSEAEIRLHDGQSATALPLARRALGIYRASAGDDNLFTAVAWEVLAKAHAANGEHAAALDAFRTSARIRETQLAADHPDLVANRADIEREACALDARDCASEN